MSKYNYYIKETLVVKNRKWKLKSKTYIVTKNKMIIGSFKTRKNAKDFIRFAKEENIKYGRK